MFLRTHTYVQPNDAISIRQNNAQPARAAIEIRTGHQLDSVIDLTDDRLRELRDLIGTYLTGRAGQPAPPTDDVPPRPLSDDDIDAAVDAMTEPQVRAALRWMAGAAPKDFAGAVWVVERQRPVEPATCGGGCSS